MFSPVCKFRVLIGVDAFRACHWIRCFFAGAAQGCALPQTHDPAPCASRRPEMGRQRVSSHHVGAGTEARRIPLLGMVWAERRPGHRPRPQQRSRELDQV